MIGGIRWLAPGGGRVGCRLLVGWLFVVLAAVGDVCGAFELGLIFVVIRWTGVVGDVCGAL